MLNEDNVDRFHVRRSPRLKNFDYSTPNYYFVTICTREKKCLFGTPEELSMMGQTAALCLQEMENHFKDIHLDKWVVMPNHIHAIVALLNETVDLSTVVGQFKAATTRKIRSFAPGMNVWQTSFHDHVIRNQADYERIWTYIEGNPVRWADDCFYQMSNDP